MGDVPEASSAKVRVPTLKISLPELPVGYTRDQHLILNIPIKVELRSKAVDSSEQRSLLKRLRQDGDDEDEQPIDAKATRYALRDGEEPAEDIMSSQEVPATQVADFPLVPQGAHDDSLITPAVPKASSPPLVTQWDPKAAPPSWESMGPKQQIVEELAHELKEFSRDDAAEYVDVVDVADSLPS